MALRRFLLTSVLTVSFALTACGNNDQASTSTTSTPTSETTTNAASPRLPTPTPPATTSEPTPDVEEQVAEYVSPSTPTPSEPYVLYCSEGTPGPAIWSDGEMRFSQDCFDTLTANRGDYRCPQTDFYVYDPSECGGSPTDSESPPVGGDPSTWDYDGPRNENGDPLDHPQLNWPE